MDNVSNRNVLAFCEMVKHKYGINGFGRIIKYQCYIFADFIEFFELCYALKHEQLILICKKSNIGVQSSSHKTKARGFNFRHGDKFFVVYAEGDSPSGKVNTILHEFAEIIICILLSLSSAKAARLKNMIESFAESFSASVYVPDGIVNECIDKFGPDVFEIRRAANCSYATAFYRMHAVWEKKKTTADGKIIPLFSILYERPYWNRRKDGKTPQLKRNGHRITGDFGFWLYKNNLNKINFQPSGEIKNEPITIRKIASKANRNMFFRNIRMIFLNTINEIDLIIIRRKWKKYKYQAKVMIHIMPSGYPDLYRLAERYGSRSSNFSEFMEGSL